MRLSSTWVVSYAPKPFPEPPREQRGIVAAEEALAIVDRAVRDASNGKALIRLADAADEMRFMDVLVCAWGWALLVNDAGVGGGSYATSSDAAHNQAEWFEQPRGDGFDLERSRFVRPDAARRAVEAYFRAGKLWNGVAWSPMPPDDALIG
jgi:hypothetical protein